MSPSAGTRPDAGQLVDLDELLSAYHRPPEGPVAFGTSGHRGTSLKGTFNEAHVLAISEAICRYRGEQGIDGPLFVGARHARAVRARVPHRGRGARRARGRGARRRGARLHADAGAQPRDPHPQPRGRAHGGRHRAHALAQPARGRRLQVQPAERRAGRTRDVTKAIEDAANRAARGRARRRAARAATPSAQVTPHDYVAAYVDDLPNVIDIDAIRDAGVTHRRRPARRRERRLLRRRSATATASTSTVVNDEIDPTFRFVPLDHDGKIRMDCSSPYAMAGLIELRTASTSPSPATRTPTATGSSRRRPA